MHRIRARLYSAVTAAGAGFAARPSPEQVDPYAQGVPLVRRCTDCAGTHDDAGWNTYPLHVKDSMNHRFVLTPQRPGVNDPAIKTKVAISQHDYQREHIRRARPPDRPPTAFMPRQYGWVQALRELAVQLDQGVVYDRHLVAIATALDDVVRAVHRRTRPRG